MTINTAPTITLKSISHNERMSDETHCYSATLYVDGDKWGEVSNHGHGGPDSFHPVKGKGWDDLRALNERIEATMAKIEAYGMTLTPSLETICGDLVNEWLREKDFKRAMSRKVLFTQDGKEGIFEISVKRGATLDQTLVAIRRQKPEWRILQDMPLDEAKAIYFADAKG
jgi:hypothetical protein